MLREMAEALNVVTAAQPLVLVLEACTGAAMPPWTCWRRWHTDANRPSRFLLLGTYRPPDALQRGHPLHTVTNLHMHGQCAELPLTLLSEAAMADYLATLGRNSRPSWRA